MYYLKFKKAKLDVCNICLKNTKLSWDHVPPKGGINLIKVEMKSLLQKFTSKNPKVLRESQNGVKYRTICKKCNEILGLKYDKEINEFSKSVSNYLNTKLILPEIIHHKARPALMIRSILGHLLSAKVELDKVKFDEIIREIIFDEKKSIPNDIKIFYWIYPYSQTVVVRDCMMPAKRGNFSDFAFFHLLKYYPIAYLVTDADHYEKLLELTKYRALNFDDEVEIPIILNRVEHPDWPEIVDEGNILFGGQSTTSSIVAKPKFKRNKVDK